MRISLDSKAKIKVGPFSRGGQSRGLQATQAADHDMGAEATVVPFGILEVSRGQQNLDQLWIAMGLSRETSDFIADALHQWWNERQTYHEGIKRLHVELDNGPELNSSRTQFMKRIVEFCDYTGLEVELVYLPPYHSKYNPIERCWGVLENHWNGALLTSVETVLQWASTMTWRGNSPIIRLIQTVYERGVKLTRKEFKPISARMDRNSTLPKWSVTIQPTSA